MRPRVRTMILAGVVALGGLLGAGVGKVKAQAVVNPPGGGVYPGSGYAPVYRAYPVRWRYGYGSPGVYGRRVYRSHYRSHYARPRYGYRRW
jgi:hypothetical protein